MQPEIQSAYDHFLQTGRVDDYLQYASLAHPSPDTQNQNMGEECAYHDRRDRSAGARG